VQLGRKWAFDWAGPTSLFYFWQRSAGLGFTGQGGSPPAVDRGERGLDLDPLGELDLEPPGDLELAWALPGLAETPEELPETLHRSQRAGLAPKAQAAPPASRSGDGAGGHDSVRRRSTGAPRGHREPHTPGAKADLLRRPARTKLADGLTHGHLSQTRWGTRAQRDRRVVVVV
jgi:hypothetical protein